MGWVRDIAAILPLIAALGISGTVKSENRLLPNEVHSPCSPAVEITVDNYKEVIENNALPRYHPFLRLLSEQKLLKNRARVTMEFCTDGVLIERNGEDIDIHYHPERNLIIDGIHPKYDLGEMQFVAEQEEEIVYWLPKSVGIMYDSRDETQYTRFEAFPEDSASTKARYLDLEARTIAEIGKLIKVFEDHCAKRCEEKCKESEDENCEDKCWQNYDINPALINTTSEEKQKLVDIIVDKHKELDNFQTTRFYFSEGELEESLQYRTGKREVAVRGYELFTGFEHQIKAMLAARGIDEDFAYLTFPESTFNPMAISGSDAIGAWQIKYAPIGMDVPRPGRNMSGYWYGRQFDERRDPIKETKAAITILMANYTETGDMVSALTMYNQGFGNYFDTIMEVGSNDHEQLMLAEWQDSITPETEEDDIIDGKFKWGARYVPADMAAINAMRAFELDEDLPRMDPINSYHVYIHKETTIAELAEMSNIEPVWLQIRNLDLKGSHVYKSHDPNRSFVDMLREETDPEKILIPEGYVLRVPREQKSQFLVDYSEHTGINLGELVIENMSINDAEEASLYGDMYGIIDAMEKLRELMPEHPYLKQDQLRLFYEDYRIVRAAGNGGWGLEKDRETAMPLLAEIAPYSARPSFLLGDWCEEIKDYECAAVAYERVIAFNDKEFGKKAENRLRKLPIEAVADGMEIENGDTAIKE